ncbi:MAG: cyclic nucleotide-binding domain-containing protein [Candidatus Dadabacteria bacterium]|nr:cyclic nucleotide-binding domain-containing protein [Candidatus Dadabacteria bacterium]
MNNVNVRRSVITGLNKSKVSFISTQLTCKTCQIEQFFHQIGIDHVFSNILYNHAENFRRLYRGEHLFRQGEKLLDLFIIRTGIIKLYHITGDGNEQVVNFCYPGELLSLESIESKRHHYSAKALDTTTVYNIQYNRVLTLCQKYPNLFYQLLKIASHEINNLHTLILRFRQKTTEEIFATFILETFYLQHKNGQIRDYIKLYMTKLDIANYLGFAYETVSRLFAKFSKAGILDFDKRTIRILNFNHLHSLASSEQKEFLKSINN